MSRPTSGWTRKPIGSLCNLLNGRAFKPSDWSTEGRPIVRIQNLNDPDAKFNYYAGTDVRDRFLIDAGALLFAWSGTPGTSFGAHIWNGGPAILNQHIFNVVFDERQIDKRFFRLAINQKLDELIDKAHGGVGLRHVTKGKFEETEIDLPPLDEQRGIVAKLDSLLGRSNGAREQLAPIEKLIRRYKEAVLDNAFRGVLPGLRRASEFKHIPFGRVVASTFYGPRIASAAYVEHGIPTLRTTDIGDWGRLTLQSPPQVSVGPDALERWEFRDQDLMVTRTGATIGKCALYEKEIGPALPSAYLIRVRLRLDQIHGRYALLFLLSPSGQRQLLSGRTAVAQPNINARAITALEIPVPDMELQQQVVAYIDAAFAWIDDVATEHAGATRLLARLDNAILDKAFRGELLVS
jgi:type I restriction enzyme, S subunit